MALLRLFCYFFDFLFDSQFLFELFLILEFVVPEILIIPLVRKGDSADTDAISLPSSHDGAATYYTLDGTPLSHPRKGVNIVRKTSGGKTKTYKLIK